jgi:SAM-dependent methyltransferase/glycosyltransferase involved in cell wall biosynthesis
MEFSGERFLPDSSSDGELEHVHRYLLAKKLAVGKVVLDIASGEGYGSRLLASVAQSVVGVDISEQAVAHACSKYVAPNLRFAVGSCAKIPVDDASIDLLVSFETIEHHTQHEEMLREIKRVLKPGGLLFISSPDKKYYSDVRSYVNEFHVRELYRAEFVELLERHFSNVELLNQRLLYGSAIFSERTKSTALTMFAGQHAEREFAGVAEPLYLIALASMAHLPELPQSVFETPLIKSDTHTELARRAKQLEGMLAGTHAAFVDRDARLVESQSEINRVTDLAQSVGQTASQLAIQRDHLLTTAELDRLRSKALVNDNEALKVEVQSKVQLLSSVGLQLQHEAQLHATAQSDIQNLTSELNAVYRSKSWRLTAPLRLFLKIVAGKLNTGAKVASLPAPSVQNDPRVFKQELGGTRMLQDEVKPPRKILLVSHYYPTRAHAGGLRILDMYALIRANCPAVQIDLFTHHRPKIDWKIDDVYQIFDHVYLSPAEVLDPAQLQKLRGYQFAYDVVDLQFHNVARLINDYRSIGQMILYTPMESLAKSFFLDIKGAFFRQDRFSLVKAASSARAAMEEIGFVQKADQVVCVSRSDAAFLKLVSSQRHIRGIDTGISGFEFTQALASEFVPVKASERPCRLLYLAYLGSETNIIALRWYLDHVHPLVKMAVPEYVFAVAGRGDLAAFEKYREASVEFVGEVAAIAPEIAKARVCIAPALGGSGFRGKVNQYSVLGCPSVISPIAHKGLSYVDGVNVFIAESPELFAQRCVQLLQDFSLNDRMGLAARELCLKRYSWQSKWPAISKIYGLETNREL